jgi:Putative lactococcus lactis phage r1t holin
MEKLKAYHAYATERAMKTVAQTLIAFITASSALSIVDLDFVQALGVAALAGVMSLLTSVLTYDKEPSKEG